ncbi:MAG TPA: hypothetical protein VM261_39275 [Kofleriaceae bacterium]|nr:hypothetical protein [Kofleriaceae bacterium]
MTRDDDTPSPIPAPDAAADGAEKARARAFGDLVDKVIAGKAPAAVPAEERALLEVATVIRAATRPVELGAARTRSVVESALAAAIERKGGGTSRLTDPSLPVSGMPGIVPIGRGRGRKLAPWIVAGVTSAVAAAAILLLLARPVAKGSDGAGAPVATAPLAEHLRSRPADPLIGVISAAPKLDDAGAATMQRIDTIYADRLAGYRERRLSGISAGATRRGGTP